MIPALSEITTAEQLLALPRDGNRYELVNGVLKTMSPAGSEHGRIAGRLFLRLATYVEQKGIGESYAAETGFRIRSRPDTVRAPDAAFVSHLRLATVEATRGYLSLAPDLVVEVISPGDTFSDVEKKAADWLEAGSLAVLIADPVNRCLHDCRAGSRQILRAGETFHAGDACPGWSLDVNDVFGQAGPSRL